MLFYWRVERLTFEKWHAVILIYACQRFKTVDRGFQTDEENAGCSAGWSGCLSLCGWCWCLCRVVVLVLVIECLVRPLAVLTTDQWQGPVMWPILGLGNGVGCLVIFEAKCVGIHLVLTYIIDSDEHFTRSADMCILFRPWNKLYLIGKSMFWSRFGADVMDSPPGAPLCAPLRLPVTCARSAVGSGTWPPPDAIQFGIRGKRRDAILKNMRQLSFRQPLPAPPPLSGCRTKREGRGGVGSWMMTWPQTYHNEFKEKHGLCFST